MSGYQVIIREKIIQQDMYYKNQIVMKYTIKYPQFISAYFYTVSDKLNSYYRTRAHMYEKSNVMNLYQMATVEHEYSMANDFPFRQFEAYIAYVVPYNQNCAVSLYFDQYEYAGGAHGLTTRTSDTWNMQKSKKIQLSDLFPHKSNVGEYVTSYITEHIVKSAEGEKSQYFEDYEKLVKDNFKAGSFYLTKEGVVIYFQQYDIAPYAVGLPEFLIPYTPVGATAPKCSPNT